MNNLQTLENVLNNNNIQSSFAYKSGNLSIVKLENEYEEKITLEFETFDSETGAPKVTMKQILELLS